MSGPDDRASLRAWCEEIWDAWPSEIVLALLDREAAAVSWANTMEHERDWERDVVQSELRSRIEAFEAAAHEVLGAVKSGHEHEVDEALSLLAECLAARPFGGELDDARPAAPGTAGSE